MPECYVAARQKWEPLVRRVGSGLPHSAAKRIIVEAVIKLGAELGVRVIAEGVEQETERDMLATMGCALA